jgi:glycosyltransferase involved in cell wall biosynthesis
MIYEVRGFQEDSWTSRREKAGGTEFYIGRFRTETQCMKGADRVVTLAEVMKADIVARGVEPDRIHIIPNGVDVERFTPRPKNTGLVRSLGMEDRVVLGYISTLVSYEGVDTLLRAIEILLRRGAKVSGLVVGDGPELEPLRELTATLGIEEHVKLVGRVPHDQVMDYYSTIDVFVVPRRNLRVCNLITPLKPFEAMAMERALLVSDVDALREIVAPPERGFTFKAEDPESLATEALRLVENPDLRRKLGETARAWVVRERTWARNGARYRALYDELLEERRARLARR